MMLPGFVIDQKLPSTVPRVRDQRERRGVPLAVIDFSLVDE